MSYRYEVEVQGKWYPNKVYFATHEEAQRAGRQKFNSWTQCDAYRVVEDTESVNYRFDDEGHVIHIATSGE